MIETIINSVRIIMDLYYIVIKYGSISNALRCCFLLKLQFSGLTYCAQDRRQMSHRGYAAD